MSTGPSSETPGTPDTASPSLPSSSGWRASHNAAENGDGHAPRRYEDAGVVAVPHYEQFAGQWSAGFRKYWSRGDEATRASWMDALAMRRDPFTEELFSLRVFPVVSLPWSVVPENTDDQEQVDIAGRCTRLIESIPFYQEFKLWLMESLFYSKSANQIVWGDVLVDGEPGTTVTYWEPVDGDSLIPAWSGVMGVLVRAGWSPPPGHEHAVIEQGDRGRVLMLHDEWWRDRFVIMKFRRSSADFMFEGDMAGAMHGKGMRSRTYYGWRRRMNYIMWRENAAQRFPINGTFVAYYPQGNPAARDEALKALKLMSQQNFTAFPVPPGKEGVKWFERLDAPTAGYEQFDNIIGELEDSLRRCWLGQELSSTVRPTGLGSEGLAQLQGGTREAYLRYDAGNLDETLTEDLLKVIIKLNTWTYQGQLYHGQSLPFRLKVVSQIDKANVQERSQAIETGQKIGLELSKEQSYKDLGLSPPRNPEDALQAPSAMGGMPGMSGAMGGLPGMSDAMDVAGGLPGMDDAGNGDGEMGDEDTPSSPLLGGVGAEGPGGGGAGGEPKTNGNLNNIYDSSSSSKSKPFRLKSGGSGRGRISLKRNSLNGATR